MFSIGSKERQVLRADQIEPEDAPITRVLAKKIYRDYMLQTGHLEKDELADHVEYLVDEMNDHEEELKDERDEFRENLAEEKRELAEAKKALKAMGGSGDEEHWEDEVKTLKESVHSLAAKLEDVKQRLTAFKADKRSFLVEYINQEVFAEEWERLKAEALKADAQRLGKCYRMVYEDGSGHFTERDTGPLVPEGAQMLTGYCFLRKDRRTFKVSRIESLKDLRLNMAVDPRSLFAPASGSDSEPVQQVRPQASSKKAVPVPPLPAEDRSVSLLLGVGILLMPYIFAWLLLRPGYSKEARALAFAWMALMVVGMIAQ